MGIVNTILTKFTTAGAANVVKDTEAITRSQTRMGQASAGSSRQFAAQSKGLGGLVAAYAGAAATMFALQAAFDALNRAAQAENMIKGTNALAAVTAQQGPAILSMIKEVTNGQLSMAEAAQNANIALSSGFDTKQIEGLVSVATKASKTLGRDLTDSIQRLVRGTSKLEPELLDELGIFVRIEPAVKAYAKQLGVSAKSLTDFQRRQAFANAAIEEGTRKFAAIDTTLPSSQRSLEQLSAGLSDLSTKFLGLVANILKPFIDFINGDLGNSFVLFIGILALVFGKAKSIILDFTHSSVASFDGWATGYINNTKKVQNALDGLATSQEKFKTMFTTSGGRAGTKGYTDVAGNQYLAGTGSARQIQGPGSRQLQSDFVKLRDEYLKGNIKDVKDLGAAIATTEAAMNNLTKAGKENTIAFLYAKQMNEDFTKAQKEAGKTSGLVVSGLANIARGAKLMETAINFAFGAFNVIFLISSVLELFGIDVIGGLVSWIQKLGKVSEQTSRGMVGAFASAAGGSKVLVDNLTKLGAKQEELEKSNEKLAETYQNVLQVQKTLAFAGGNIGASGTGGLGGFMPGGVKKEVSVLEAAQTQLAALRQEAAAATGDRKTEALKTIEYLKVVIAGITKYDMEVMPVLAGIADGAGVSTEQVAKAFNSMGIAVKGVGDTFTVAGVSIAKTVDGFDINSITEAQRNLVFTSVSVQNALDETNAAYQANAIDASSLAQRTAGLQASLISLTDSYEKRANELKDQGRNEKQIVDAMAGTTESINTQRAALEELIAKQKELQELESVYKSLTSAFSKEIGLGESLIYSGQAAYDAKGQLQFAKDETEQLRNRMSLLNNIATSYKSFAAMEEVILQKTKDHIELSQYEKDNRVEISEKAKIYEATLEAINGTYYSILQQAQALTAEMDVQNKAIIQEIENLKSQKAVIPIQAKIDQLQFQSEALQSAATFNEEFKRNQIKLIELKVEAKQITPVEGATQINAIESSILVDKRALLDQQEQIAKDSYIAEVQLLITKSKLAQDIIRQEAEAQRTKIQNEFEALKATVTTYNDIAGQLQTALTNGGNTAGKAIVDNINSGISALVASFGGLATAFGMTTQTANFTPVEAPALPTIEAGAISSAETKMKELLASVDELEAAKLEAARNELNLAIDTAGKKRILEKQAYEQSVALLMQQDGIERAQAEKRIADAKNAGGGGEKEVDKIEERLQALFDSIKGHIETAIMGLNDLIFYGEGNFGDIMGNMFKSIQQDFFKQTIATPLSDMITGALFGNLGVKKGVDGLTYDNNSLLVKITNPLDMSLSTSGGLPTDPADSTKGVFSGFFDQISNLFGNIFGQNGVLAKLFSGLLGEGGILSGLFKGIGGFFSTLLGYSSGGLVHLAQGGAAVSSTLQRDRIPAMLEPGEFVIRRPAARAIGMPALQSMNATGTASSSAPTINITNEGTAKDVQASQPRFDGDKYVIDVVMRDLSNNGPIRRSLRGRGGL